MKIREIIVVEGKYDEIAVKKACEAVVLTTNGFGIFKDKALQDCIAKMAKERGVIILTDSDRAGYVIRQRIETCVGKQNIKNAYIPTVAGKEKRKAKPSKEGNLGVEGMSIGVIQNALRRCAATIDEQPSGTPATSVTKADLYADGLSGTDNCTGRKRRLLKALCLPENLSTKKMLEAINLFLTYEEYKTILENEEL